MEKRVIAVTGAFGSLGRAVVKSLAADGCEPVAIDLSTPQGDHGASLVIGRTDSADPASARAAVRKILDAFGRLDGLVNVAGGFTWETIAEGSIETWDRMYRVNVRTALCMSQAALPALLEGGGAIVNIGAAASTSAAAGMGAYAASKSAVARLTEALADECKDRGVRVNAVLPTIIDTPANRAAMPDADVTKWVDADAIARLVVFLLSDRSSAVTGSLLLAAGRM